MDRIPPKLPNTCSRLIAMAVSLVGEAQSVMLEMRCSQMDFREYCAGVKEPPSEELDRLISLLVAEQRKLIAQNREFIEQARAKSRGAKKDD